MKKRMVLRKITEHAGLPMEALPGIPLLELCGDDRILIENHVRLIEYSEHEIIVRMKFGTVRICGNNLIFACLQKDRLIIRGEPVCISLERGR